MSKHTTAKDEATKISYPTGNMTLSYVISLSIIAGLSIVVHFMFERIIAEQSDTAIVVNISGQQGMLSQQASLFTLEYLNSGSAEFKTEAAKTLNTMQKNHQYLLQEHFRSLQDNQPSPLSESMQNLYFELPHQLDKNVKDFSQLINLSLNMAISGNNEDPEAQNRHFWQLAKKPLLASLNTVLKQYESESLSKVNELRGAQQFVFSIIIFTILVEALFIFRPMVSKVKRLAERLQQEASFDQLSGLFNRRAFAILAKKAVAHSIRYKDPLSLLTFDIDHFKSVKDSYGHDVGDTVIQHIGDIIKNSVRESDTVARFGGEEFVVLLPQTDEADAMLLAEKVRQKIENTPLELPKLIIEMTASCGISQFAASELAMDAMLKRSDKALYQAKKQGRNRVCQA